VTLGGGKGRKKWKKMKTPEFSQCAYEKRDARDENRRHSQKVIRGGEKKKRRKEEKKKTTSCIPFFPEGQPAAGKKKRIQREGTSETLAEEKKKGKKGKPAD